MKERSIETVVRKQFLKRKILKAMLLINILILPIWGIKTHLISGLPYFFKSRLNHPSLIVVDFVICAFWELFLFIIWYKVYTSIYDQTYSVNIANTFLSTENYIEVIPQDTGRYTSFMTNLTNIAKFYAIINEELDVVIIKLLFDNEEEMRFVESIRKQFFYNSYMIK